MKDAEGRDMDVVRTVVVRLEGRQIPRNAQGDPAFGRIEDVFSVFTPEEIVALVNRQLYQMEYQRTVHRNRAAQEREQLKPIKDKYKAMFGKPFTKATDQELEKVLIELKREADNAER